MGVRRGRTGGILVAVALSLAWPAAPAPPSSVADPEGTVVSELVVQAREPGPPWWRVEGKGSVVYILGVPDGAVPPKVGWDRTVLERRLTGAKAVVGSPSFQAGLRDIPAALRLRAQLKSKTPMEAGLPPALAGRWAADVARGGKAADRYSHWQPMAAGAFLLRESRDGWRSVEPQVWGLARRQGLKPQSSARYPAMPLVQKAMAGMTPAVQAECLGYALDDVEAGEAPARRAAEAWARGDVAGALAAPRGFDRCLLILAGGAELWAREAEDQAADIAAALQTPGKAVAVVGLRRLLAENGVVARLEARGLKVAGPGEP
ncbi:TraB/GumN family protein [Phenylobacterium sp.]|uniref:TraB/GumN family protein n=1 Tax=Phenylobacterium sp. TaxID=1871053 RepID=UPI0012005754|nr:TraB/GumN family protein [Phenylobacterium sp.]THD64398.1 MAG: TraB/GumN family protein [Phenylobacterium sp.]